MTIGLFRLDQLESILKLERAVFPEDAYDREMFLDLHRKCGGLFFVAKVDGEVAGYAVSCLARGNGEIVSLGVARRFRRHGVGKALMRRTLRALASAGARAAVLAVRVDNTAAIEFYRGFGFRSERRVPRYYQDGGGALRMRRLLI